MPTFPAATLRRQIADTLIGWGMSHVDAPRTAEIMVDADLRGIDSHGISMLPIYEGKRASGSLRLDASAQVVRDDGRAAVVIDGRAGLGHLPAAEAMGQACDRATRFGVGVGVVRNSHHFGAAGYYARLAAERGHLGLVTTSARTLSQAPTGGAQRRLGTNPLAFAAPSTRGRDPFLLDMSTTVVAVNKVKSYALTGRDLPAAWVVDSDGEPVHDADRALQLIRHGDAGGLAPLGGTGTLNGGHKGYGLAMMVQILSAALSGAALPGEGPPDDIGHLMLAIDPAALGGSDSARQYVADLVATMHGTQPLDPGAPVLVAGEPEALRLEERRRHGIPLPPSLLHQLRDICDRHDITFHLHDPDTTL